MRDMAQNEFGAYSLNPAVLKAATNGNVIIDLAGYEGAVIYIGSGTITDGTLATFELKDGDAANLSDAAAVVDANLLPGPLGVREPGFLQASEANAVRSFGYIGPKRYLRVDLVTYTGSPSTGGLFWAAVVRGVAHHLPAGVTQLP